MAPNNAQTQGSAASLRRKVVWSVDSPYTAAKWPEISSDDQDVILELLSILLAPLARHAQTIQPSKGRRARKRKRQAESKEEKIQLPSPPPPEIAKFVDIGLASITRNLQEVAGQQPLTKQDEEPTSSQPPYALIFVARSGHASPFISHLPQMVAVASRSSPSLPPIRLVGYSKACDQRLSDSTGIPRVSAVGIRHGAPGLNSLVEYVQSTVSPVVVPWLEEAKAAEYLSTRILSEEKMVPVQKTTQR